MNPGAAIIVFLSLAAVLLFGSLAYFGTEPVAGVAPGRATESVATGSAEPTMDDADTFDGPRPGREGPAAPSLRLAGEGNLLAGLAAVEDARGREAYLDGVVRRLAALGPEVALAQVQQLPDAEMRDMAMLALLQEWSGVSTLELIRSGDIWRFGTPGALSLHLLEKGLITPERAAELARSSTDANRRSELLARVATSLAASDPAAALALVDGLGGRERQRFAERVATDLAGQSPEAARQLASQTADPGLRDAMLTGILAVEAASDPAAAARNFASMPPESRDGRARAARTIAQEWAANDTVSAMQWASGLADEGSRQAAQQGIQAAAPVGIGARLGRGDGGVPVLEAVVPGSPAGASGQLQPGDAILAVSGPNGSWVDSRSVRMGELIGMIRGEPNTQVSLQVQSPGQAAPRTVTLGRQQIINRPQ